MLLVYFLIYSNFYFFRICFLKEIQTLETFKEQQILNIFNFTSDSDVTFKDKFAAHALLFADHLLTAITAISNTQLF